MNNPPELFKFRRVNEITGIFVLIIFALLIAIIVWTGHSQRWFKRNITLRIALPEAGAAGIRQGSEVYFLGTLVGFVSAVEVDATGRMEARTKIRHDFFRFVRADSSASVKRKFGVAGDSFFEITRGEGKPLPEEGAAIACKDQFQSTLETAVEEVRNEALLVLKKINGGLDAWTTLGTNLLASRERLDQLTGRVDNIVAGVQAGKGAVGKLLTDPALVDETQKLLARANATMVDLQGMMTNLDIAAQNVRNGTMRLPEITDAVADESKNLPGLVQQTQTSMRELQRLMEALQKSWFIRKHVNPTNPPPAHLSR